MPYPPRAALVPTKIGPRFGRVCARLARLARASYAREGLAMDANLLFGAAEIRSAALFQLHFHGNVGRSKINFSR